MLDEAGVNSCILHNFNDNENLSQRQFLTELFNSLLKLSPYQERIDKLLKLSRCNYCNWRLDRKTTTACIGDVHSARRQLPVIFGTSVRRDAPNRNLMFIRTPSRFIIV